MTLTAISEQGAIFTVDHESCPERAYKDPGGVVTVGPGLTMLSAVFASYWNRTRGHALRIGDTLPKAEAIKVFRTVMDEEYASAVARNIGTDIQHVFDGAADVAYNAGVGSTVWNWAKALKAGDVTGACRMLLTTAITAGGKRLQGLVNRRADESKLIEHGDYGAGPTTEGGSAGISVSPESIKEYQGWLTTLGYYKGNIDGTAGKGSLTEGAIKNFQRAQPGLKVDGRVGPATRSALIRAVNNKGQGLSVTGAGTVGGGAGVGLHLDWWWVLGGAAVLVVALIVGFYLWNNRGAILRYRTPA